MPEGVVSLTDMLPPLYGIAACEDDPGDTGSGACDEPSDGGCVSNDGGCM